MALPLLPPVVRRVIAHTRAAMAPADADARARRTAICRSCPHLLAAPVERCSRCGCPIASKSFLQRATCPDNPPRW